MVGYRQAVLIRLHIESPLGDGGVVAVDLFEVLAVQIFHQQLGVKQVAGVLVDFRVFVDSRRVGEPNPPRAAVAHRHRRAGLICVKGQEPAFANGLVSVQQGGVFLLRLRGVHGFPGVIGEGESVRLRPIGSQIQRFLPRAAPGQRSRHRRRGQHRAQFSCYPHRVAPAFLSR